MSVFQVRLVGHVLLGLPDPERRDVAAFAVQRGLDEKVVRGQLIASLDALVAETGLDGGAGNDAD